MEDNMPSTQEDLIKAQERAKAVGTEAGQYESGALSLSSQVMEAVRADRSQRGVSQLATDVGATLGQIPTDTAGIRQRAGNMVNPMDVDVETARQRGQNLNTLGTTATQSEYNQGTLTDILGEQSNKMKAIAAAKYAEAQRAADEANNLWKQIEFDEGVRQFNEELSLRKSTAAGSGDGGLGALLQAIMGQEQATQGGDDDGFIPDDNAGPQQSPVAGEGAVSGQWVFKNGQWVQNTPQKFSVWDSIKALLGGNKPSTGGGGGF
jgi:hypothetical protein